MSLSSSQMQAQAKPAEDIEDIIELQADVTKYRLSRLLSLRTYHFGLVGTGPEERFFCS